MAFAASSQLKKPRVQTTEGESSSMSPPAIDTTFTDDKVDEVDPLPIFVPTRDLEPAAFLQLDDTVAVAWPEVIWGNRADDEDGSLRVDVDSGCAVGAVHGSTRVSMRMGKERLCGSMFCLT